MVSEKKNFLVYSIISLWELMTPRGVASLGPGDLIGRIHVGGHYTLLHSKYVSCVPHGFREKDFLSFPHYKSMGANNLRDVASLDPRG